MISDHFEGSPVKCNTILRTAVGDLFLGDRLPDSFPALHSSHGQQKA